MYIAAELKNFTRIISYSFSDIIKFVSETKTYTEGQTLSVST